MGYPFSGWGWGAGWGYHPFLVRDRVPVGDVTPSGLGIGYPFSSLGFGLERADGVRMDVGDDRESRVFRRVAG